jgi:hypothetical protein
MRVEHEYDRGGALAYLAAWDVRRGGAIGRREATTGKAPFGRLVEQVMGQEPYRSAPRVFMDNGSSHRGVAAAERLQERYPNLVLVHLPTHASWLNQIEIYFSMVGAHQYPQLRRRPTLLVLASGVSRNKRKSFLTPILART